MHIPGEPVAAPRVFCRRWRYGISLRSKLPVSPYDRSINPEGIIVATLVGRDIYAALTLGLGVVITWLELYPFRFRVPIAGPGALQMLLQTWAKTPKPSDFILNVIAYVSLGFCATMTLGYPKPRLGSVIIIVLIGLICSVSFELTQYFIPGRYTSAVDVYANTLGVLIGSASAALLYTT